jgi:hypothetical protein
VAALPHLQDQRRLARLVRRRADREHERAERAWGAAASAHRPELAAGFLEQARVHHEAEAFYLQQAERFEARAARSEGRALGRHLTLVVDAGKRL